MKCRQIPKGMSADLRVVLKKMGGHQTGTFRSKLPGLRSYSCGIIQEFLMAIKELFWP